MVEGDFLKTSEGFSCPFFGSFGQGLDLGLHRHCGAGQGASPAAGAAHRELSVAASHWGPAGDAAGGTGSAGRGLRLCWRLLRSLRGGEDWEHPVAECEETEDFAAQMGKDPG